MSLDTYEEIMTELTTKKRKVNLLLGNGFSQAYNPKIFSYNALHKFIEELDNELLSKLFEIVNTKNFELVLQQLDNFSELIDAFGTDNALKEQVEEASFRLKESLISAVEELHPEHVFKMSEEKSKACSIFLSTFFSNNGQIFTTNYDVLLYWVLLRHKIPGHVDGFGRDKENTEDLELSELRWGRNKKNQNTHYVHGALPLFDTGVEIIKEEYSPNNLIMNKIKARLNDKEYPVFVTAGNSNQKLTHIMHNKYLSNCYEHLTDIEGSLITFGFNFGEYDDHIIDAINIASENNKEKKFNEKLWSIYIGVYSDDDKKHIDKISSKFKCKVRLYDAKTAPVWG